MFENRIRLFKDRNYLSPLYVPETLQDRESEMIEVSGHLSYALEGFLPSPLLIIGPPGSGKTVGIKYVFSELKQRGIVFDIAYVVADGTAYQILSVIAKNIGCSVPLRGVGFIEVWSVFERQANERGVIVALDELDKLLIKKGEDLLYHLSRHPNVCVIGLSNKLTIMDMIRDPRILSSFEPTGVTFPPYNANQLLEILNYRAERGFQPGILDESVIPLCAALAAQKNGDARYAIDLLSFSATMCIRRRGDKITEQDVRDAEKEVEVEFIRRGIERLSRSQKILLYCVHTTRKDNSPTEIYRCYNKHALEWNCDILTQRRLSDLMRGLELYGLVDIIRKGRGRGKGTDWLVYPAVVSQVDSPTLIEALERSLSLQI